MPPAFGTLVLRPWREEDLPSVVKAFTFGDYVRVQATAESWNIASIRVLEKAGMQREGLLHSYVVYGDRVADAYLYAAVRGDV